MTDPTDMTVDTTGGDDLLNQLVGADKKFKTVVDLAKGKLEADTFISKLADENRALRALIQNGEESKRSTEIMSELLAKVSQGTHPNVQNDGNQPVNGGSNQSQALTSKDVEVLFKNLRQQEREDANEKMALSKLSEKYGDKVEDFLNKKAAELALDVNVLKATARKSPNAFANLIGENNQSRPTSTSAGVKGVNTSAISELTSNGLESVRDKRYYDKLRTEMGTKKFYLDRNLQLQLHKDMMALGDRWEAA